MIDISNMSNEELRALKKDIEEKLSMRCYYSKRLLVPIENIETVTHFKYKEHYTRPYFAVRDSIINLCDYAIFPKIAFRQMPNQRSLEKPRAVHNIYAKEYKEMANELFEIFVKHMNSEGVNESQTK